jgi:3-phenylpropionate/trans-cinnamate dioxygenase ferredoxin subunit
MTEQHACNVGDLAKGGALRADLTLADGSAVIIALVHAEDGEIYAINDICTHGEVSLSEGEVDGCEIECWAHGGRFDVRTGAVTALPPIDPVPTYPVRIDGERVLVDVDAPALTKESVI